VVFSFAGLEFDVYVFDVFMYNNIKLLKLLKIGVLDFNR
jgi:hypothetical protein